MESRPDHLIIRTYSRLEMDLFNPAPEKIKIADIAEGLAYKFQFQGHSQIKFTMAQHSVWVANEFTRRGRIAVAMTALLHAATQAYLDPLPAALKKYCPNYSRVEADLYSAIAKKFQILNPLPPQILKTANSMLQVEWDSFMMLDTSVMKKLGIGDRVLVFSPEQAKDSFLAAYEALAPKL